MKKVMQFCAALLLFILACFALASAVKPSVAHADERYIFTWRSPDAGATTSTLCPGSGKINFAIDVGCNARFCYKTTGGAGKTNATVTPVTPNCAFDFLYDGGNATTIPNEGILGEGPLAHIQMSDHACIAFTSPDNPLDAGTLNCLVYESTQNWGGR